MPQTLEQKIQGIKNEQFESAITAFRLGEVLEEINYTSKIYQNGKLLLFKNGTNVGVTPEPNDLVIGFVQGTFLNAGQYLSGDPQLLTSYEGF